MIMLYVMYLDHTSVIYVENILNRDHHSTITKRFTLGGCIHVWNQTAHILLKVNLAFVSMSNIITYQEKL